MLHPIDIVTKNNTLTGRQSDPEQASNRGLWHRGVHVVITTPSEKILVEKRSHTMVHHADMLDISVGGFVDSGEEPIEAALREVREETGILVGQDQLKLLFVTRQNYRWRFGHRLKKSRVILYTYAVRLDGEPDLIPQAEEVAWVGFIPLKSAQWLVRRGSLKRLGALTPTYAYYRKILRLTQETLFP